jgi:hypothetical protein
MDIDDQRLEIRATNSCHEMIFFKKGLEVILMRRLGYTNLVVNIERWAPVRQLIALNGISATKQLLSISESVVVGSGCLHDDVVEHGKFSVKLELWRWHPASGHGILVRGRPIEPKILSSARIQIQGQSLERSEPGEVRAMFRHVIAASRGDVNLQHVKTRLGLPLATKGQRV